MAAPPLLALFYARLGDSRLAELEAVWTRLAGLPGPWCWDARPIALHGGDVGPRLVQHLLPLPAELHGTLADSAARSVGCRGVFEVWGQGDTLAECAAMAARLPADHIRARVSGSWRVESVVLGARRSALAADLGARMRHFGPVLDVLNDRPVDLHHPDHRLWLVEDRQLLHDKSPLPEPPPRHLLLYALPARRPSIQDRLDALSLRKRAFLSTSTLPIDRALQLCHLALGTAPEAGATLVDPYCGSGGILLAAAELGAATVGSDLDWRLVSDHPWPVQIPPTSDRPGRGVEAVRMRDNFEEAGLPPPKALLQLDVGAPDAAARLLAANGGARFHALVCDPPYGRREFQHGEASWDGSLSFRVPEEVLADTLAHLLTLGTQLLRPRGRLVCLLPVRSPRDSSKPRVADLQVLLDRLSARHGLRRVHLGVEAVHRGLHRAVVVLEVDRDG